MKAVKFFAAITCMEHGKKLIGAPPQSGLPKGNLSPAHGQGRHNAIFPRYFYLR